MKCKNYLLNLIENIPLWYEDVQIERLRNDGVISPWISSYMQGIRIMGNKSVHPPKKTPKYKPLKLETGDLASTLMGIRLLLEFWEKNI